MNDYLKMKMSLTDSKCKEFIPLMMELGRLNENEKPCVDLEMKFTRIEYDELLSTVDTQKYNRVKSDGLYHTFRCNNNNTECILYHLESSPLNSNLDRCIGKYADAFR
jgi:hypothetical protein